VRALAACLVASLALAAPVWAQGPAPAPAQLTPQQREQERKAVAAFAAGRYEEAVDIYSALYADYRDPIYLRNIGRCYQKMRRPDRAIASFEEYLARAKSLAPGEEDEIHRYVAEMQALAREQAAKTDAAEEKPAPPPALTPPAATLQDRVAQPDRDRRDNRAAWRWGAAGTFGAAVAVGIAGALVMKSAWSSYDDAKMTTGCQAQGPGACGHAADTVASRNRLSRLLFAGAGLLAVGGGLMLYAGYTGGRDGGVALGAGRTF
jgi:tetratricopeptide (TPR) repeat protein